MGRIPKPRVVWRTEAVPSWLDPSKFPKSIDSVGPVLQVTAVRQLLGVTPPEGEVAHMVPLSRLPVACTVCGEPTTRPHYHGPKHSTRRWGDLTYIRQPVLPEYAPTIALDRHVVYKAVNALQHHARTQGMIGAEVKFLRAIKARDYGKDVQGIKSGEFVISFLDPKGVRRHVIADLTVDPSGKFTLPQTFRTPDTQVHPFTKEAVKELFPSRELETYPRNQRSLTPTFRHPDPTRFRAVASQQDQVPETHPVVEFAAQRSWSDTFERIKGLARRANWDLVEYADGYRLALFHPTTEEPIDLAYGTGVWRVYDANTGEEYETDVYDTEGVTGAVTRLMARYGTPLSFVGYLQQQVETEEDEGKRSVLQEAVQAKNTQVALAKLNTWIPKWGEDLFVAYDFTLRKLAQDYAQPGRVVLDPATGKKYTMKQYMPGKPATATDMETQQDVAITEEKLKLLQPVVSYLSVDTVAQICPSCAEGMRKSGIKAVSTNVLLAKVAAKWQTRPKGWSEESVKKFWNSMGGSESSCAEKMSGKVDDPDAFCSALKDRVKKTTYWRGPEK